MWRGSIGASWATTSQFIPVCWISCKFKCHHIMLFKQIEMIVCSHRLEVGKWSRGRPVFKRVDGYSRFLLVTRWSNHWVIQRNTFDDAAYMQSGRATNSPSSLEAGPSVTEELTRWRYATPEWKEGDISVTCHKDLCPPLPPTPGNICDATFGTLDCHYDQDQNHCCCGKCPDRFTLSCAPDPSSGAGLWQSTSCPAEDCATEGELQREISKDSFPQVLQLLLLKATLPHLESPEGVSGGNIYRLFHYLSLFWKNSFPRVLSPRRTSLATILIRLRRQRQSK